MQDAIAGKLPLGGGNTMLLLVAAGIVAFIFVAYLLADAYRGRQRTKRYSQKRKTN